MTVIYVDESGDLGWSFNSPYRFGGSSRHLTLSAVVVSSDKKQYVKRFIKSLYVEFKTSTDVELKWSDLDEKQRVVVAEKMELLKSRLGDDLLLISISVKKEKVLPHIRKDPNKLYNYMMKCLLCKEMAKHPVVCLIPDPRSIKVESGSSMHDYLQTQLWFEQNAATQLITTPIDSKKCSGLQFADMLAGIVQNHFEDNKSSSFNVLSKNKSICISKLFF